MQLTVVQQIAIFAVVLHCTIFYVGLDAIVADDQDSEVVLNLFEEGYMNCRDRLYKYFKEKKMNLS